MSEQTLIARIDALKSKSVSNLLEIIQNLDLNPNSFDGWIPHPLPRDHYHRQLLHRGEDYEIVLAVWPTETRTLPHNHGTLSSHGMIRVLRGIIFNQIYMPADEDGLIFAERRLYKAGDLIPVPEGLIHSMGNQSPCELALSLHLYSPGIMNVTYWDPESLKKMAV